MRRSCRESSGGHAVAAAQVTSLEHPFLLCVGPLFEGTTVGRGFASVHRTPHRPETAPIFEESADRRGCPEFRKCVDPLVFQRSVFLRDLAAFS